MRPKSGQGGRGRQVGGSRCEWLLAIKIFGCWGDGCGAEEKFLVLSRPKTGRQSNGYIICREVKVADEMAGGGEREVCVPRFSLLTDLCLLSAPYFLNTRLIHFSLTCETSQH